MTYSQQKIPVLASNTEIKILFTVCRLKIKKIFRTKIFFLSKIISSFVYILSALSTKQKLVHPVQELQKVPMENGGNASEVEST